MNIVIKICSPTREEIGWGDTCFADSLAAAFKKLGHRAEVRCYDRWNDDDNAFDTCIFITGLLQYQPRPYHQNLLWCISHPEIRTPRELSAFDRVFIASEAFADTVRKDILVPVHVLQQAYDPTYIYPRERRIEHEILFVGNNYYHHFKYRKIIEDILQTCFAKRFKVIGSGWDDVLPKNQVIAGFVSSDRLPEVYGSAKINLNDHHAAMLKYGFINNRTYDLAALGCLQISDAIAGLDKLGVPVYHTPEELENLLYVFLNDSFHAGRTAKISQMLCKEATFEKRALEILEKL